MMQVAGQARRLQRPSPRIFGTPVNQRQVLMRGAWRMRCSSPACQRRRAPRDSSCRVSTRPTDEELSWCKKGLLSAAPEEAV